MADTDDARKWGERAIIYCRSHMRPHETGWCTVPVTDKLKLHAADLATADDECRRFGLPLFSDKQRNER